MKGFTIQDRGDGAAELYDNGLLIGTIERKPTQSIAGMTDRSAHLSYVARGVRYSDADDSIVNGHSMWCSIASGGVSGDDRQGWWALTDDVRRSCIEIAGETWRDDAAADEAAEVVERALSQLPEPEPSGEQTVQVTVSLGAAKGFDVEHVRDDDQPEHHDARTLVDHLTLYIGAAIDGLFDDQSRSLSMKLPYVQVQVLDGNL